MTENCFLSDTDISEQNLKSFKDSLLHLLSILDAKDKLTEKEKLNIKQCYNSAVNKLTYSGNKIQSSGLKRFFINTVLSCPIYLKKRNPDDKIKKFRLCDYKKFIQKHPHATDILWEIQKNPAQLFYRLEYLLRTNWAHFYENYRSTNTFNLDLKQPDNRNLNETYRDVENLLFLYETFFLSEASLIVKDQTAFCSEFISDSSRLIDAFQHAAASKDFSVKTQQQLNNLLSDFSDKYESIFLSNTDKYEPIFLSNTDKNAMDFFATVPSMVECYNNTHLIMLQLEAEITRDYLNVSVLYNRDAHPVFFVHNQNMDHIRHEIADDFYNNEKLNQQELSFISSSIVKNCGACSQMYCTNCEHRLELFTKIQS